jgi:hypothetical protein
MTGEALGDLQKGRNVAMGEPWIHHNMDFMLLLIA